MANWRNLKFVLPNLFTASSIFCGFYALTLCSASAGSSDLYAAALAIFFAMFFDLFDGRVARLTKTQSDFGVQLDSLADVISFGAAPAMLVYRWALESLGFVGLVCAFLFAMCGALRLARFNVISMRASTSHGPSKFFTGLPTPLAAGMIVSLVMALSRQVEMAPRLAWGVAALVALLALLMVSNVPYRTFKDVKLSPRPLAIFGVVVVLGVVAAVLRKPWHALLGAFSAYLALGIVEEILALGRKAQQPLGVADDEEEEEDYL